MLRHLIVAGAAVAALALANTSTASAYVFGVGDRADANPAVSRTLGASVYRIVIDPDRPLASYDARIYRFRAAGLEPQLVVGGTGTRRHANRWGLAEKAVEAYHRWPFAYSISVVNEPDLSGMSACGYARTYQRAYALLKAAGARRVLFGEWSPGNPMGWTLKILRRCGLRLKVDRWAWHCYDTHQSWWGVQYAHLFQAQLRAHRHQLGGHTPRLHCTEYGVLTRQEDEVAGLRKWRRALRVAGRYLSELVAWDVHSPHAGSNWDSSLIEPSGRPRPAFQTIRQSIGSRP